MVETVEPKTKKKQRVNLVAYFFLSGILTASWSSRIPDVQHKLKLSNAALGTVLFAIPVGLITGLAVASWLVASFGAKKVMWTSCCVCALFLALAGISSSVPVLMLALFFMGTARTIFNLAANTGAIEVQQLYKRPIVSFFHGTWSLACFVAAGMGTVAIVLGVLPAKHFCVIALVVVLLAVLLAGRNNNYQRGNENRPFFMAPDNYLLLLGLTALCAMLCEGAVFDWSVNYFEKVVKAGKSLRTAGYLSFIITMATGRLVGDRLIHLFGVYRLLLANGILMSAGFLIAALFPFVFSAAFGFLLIGAGSSILVPVVYLLAAKSKKMSPGYALSSVTLIGYTGFLIGPLLIGNISEKLGMNYAFFLLCGVSLLIVVLSLQVKKFA